MVSASGGIRSFLKTAKHPWQRPLWIGIGLGILAAACSIGGVLESWSDRASDRFFLDRTPDSAIVIVAIDDASIMRVGRWPWHRRVHADLIQKISAAGASVIGYDVNFPEVEDVENDTALANAIRASGRVVVPIELPLNLGGDGEITYDPSGVVQPIGEIREAAAAIGHTNAPPDSDGIVRRIPLQVTASGGSTIRSFSYEIARLAHREPEIASIPRDRVGRVIVNYPGPAARTFTTVPAIDVIQGTVDAATFKNKIVLVGATAPDLHDEQMTPTSYGTPMSGVEIHAGQLDTLLTRHWIRPIPAWVNALGLILFGCVIALLVHAIRPRWSAVILIVTWVVFLFVAFFAFDKGWIVDVVWPTLLLIFAYASITLERRLEAERQRRELRSAFSHYVSPSVVDVIMKDPQKLDLGGERRRMTVFFSDIRGFTTISEGISPEDLVSILNVYLDRMTDLVFASDGVLDKYIGDAVMAFWNAPFDQDDHALRAVKTALAMHDALDEMNAAKAFGALELHIGMGVNTGEMVVGNIGGHLRFDYTVIGDNVNLASRLEGLTKEYGVQMICTDATRGELRDEILVRRLDKVAVKGKKEPVLICEIMDLMSRASEDRKTLAKRFEEALDAYFAREFMQSKAVCGAILASHPDDGPTKNLLGRVEHFLEEPPPADWVGTWVYTKK
jgi:adenylate cyclase